MKRNHWRLLKIEHKVENTTVAKSVYKRVDSRKKLELAVHCRDYQFQYGKSPKYKELKMYFP